ncbi:polysaccharide pyruvyl transferase family protein [Roseomonas sp. OT10]|uniref:polysaccharide pyruvyl transferase family protein n=1 Tax=Roseomonas cutis TaxID=2897332 RepID=UPI001E5A3C1D|nr:polysaccharide pyruvyl transferase family protein [Roseomonas sp. OT10]UFN48940.1 polysaccharide pyruvyl transferase family protein [Roseomonas sp. OT10]
MRTAFIGAYGFGNLGDELCLIEAMREFPAAEAFAFSVQPAWTHRCVPGLAGTFRNGPEMRALAPARVVYGGGGIGTRADVETFFPWMAEALAAGAELHVHNIGVARIPPGPGWPAPVVREVLEGLASFTVRDHRSVDMVAEWGLEVLPGVTRYPERAIAPDFGLADALLPGDRPLLGLSIIDTPLMRRCLEHDAAVVEALLARFPGHAVLPVCSTLHVDSAEEDDGSGFRRFAARFLAGREILCPQLAERPFWAAEVTPRRLKGLIARLDTLISQRKHNCLHGLGAGTRTIGLSPMRDDSLRRVFVTLANQLPAGSGCIGLEDPPP